MAIETGADSHLSMELQMQTLEVTPTATTSMRSASSSAATRTYPNDNATHRLATSRDQARKTKRISSGNSHVPWVLDQANSITRKHTATLTSFILLSYLDNKARSGFDARSMDNYIVGKDIGSILSHRHEEGGEVITRKRLESYLTELNQSF